MKKTILITGATSELGQIISEFLIKENCDIILCSRSIKKMVALSKDLKNDKCKIDYIDFDYLNHSTFAKVAQKIESFTTKGLDGLIVLPPQAPPTNEALPEAETWTQLFNTSFIGPATFIRTIIPYLTKKPMSRVVLISGISSKQPLSQYATSNVLRTAWLGLSKTIADQYGPKGLRFNTLSLGGIMTEKFKNQIKTEAHNNNTSIEQTLNNRVNNIPLKRYAELNEIADMVVFLILSSAGIHLTGQNITLDGGFTRAY